MTSCIFHIQMNAPFTVAHTKINVVIEYVNVLDYSCSICLFTLYPSTKSSPDYFLLIWACGWKHSFVGDRAEGTELAIKEKVLSHLVFVIKTAPGHFN